MAEHQGRRPDRPNAAYLLIAAHGFSSFTFGLVFPYTAVYLAGRPGIGTGGVALYYACAGGAGLAAAITLALGWVRPPRIALAVAGNLVSLVGYVVLFSNGSIATVAVAGVATGAGQGCFLAAVIPIINSLVSASDRRRVFALRYQVLNGTLALGSLAAGIAILVLSRHVIRSLFLVNAFGYLPIAGALLLLHRAAEAGEQARRQAEPVGDSWPGLVLAKAMFAVVAFQLVVYLFGFSQFETTLPLVVSRVSRVGLGWISVFIAINVVVIVVAQRPLTALFERRRELFGLRGAILLWVAGYLIAAATSGGPAAVRIGGLCLFAAFFGLGECAYSCSFHPWLISKVPESHLTRGTALANSTMGIGQLAGPTIGVLLVTTGSATVVWLALATMCMAGAMSTVDLSAISRRRLVHDTVAG